MVYSQTKRTASLASISSQNTGGGPIKAGLPYQVGRGSWESIMMHETTQTMSSLKKPQTFMTHKEKVAAHAAAARVARV